MLFNPKLHIIALLIVIYSFVSFYYLFCQNAIFRGISLLEAALVIPLCGVMLREAASPFSDYSSTMIYAAILLLTGAVFVVLITIGPVMRTLFCFDAWGQRKQIRELFCTEYFLQLSSGHRDGWMHKRAFPWRLLPRVLTIQGFCHLRKRAFSICLLSFSGRPIR